MLKKEVKSYLYRFLRLTSLRSKETDGLKTLISKQPLKLRPTTNARIIRSPNSIKISSKISGVDLYDSRDDGYLYVPSSDKTI